MPGKRPRVRRSNAEFLVTVFSDNISLGWKEIRRVPVELAIEQVQLLKWRGVFYEDGTLAGVQPVKPEQRKELKQALIDQLKAVTITLEELKRNAGLYGRSRTLGRDEWSRMHGVRKTRYGSLPLPLEDSIEEAIEKVRLWPFPASVLRDGQGNAVVDKEGNPVMGYRECDKAVRCYPHPPALPPAKKTRRRARG